VKGVRTAAWLLMFGAIGMGVGVGVREAGGRKFSDEIQSRPPKNYVSIESCAPGKGTLWVDRQTADERFRVRRRPPYEAPTAALGYQTRKLVLVQYRFLYSNLTREHKGAWLGAGEGWTGVDHMDLIYSKGTPDYPEPYYEVRLYLVSHSEHESYCSSAGKPLRERTKSPEDATLEGTSVSPGHKPKDRVRGEGGGP